MNKKNPDFPNTIDMPIGIFTKHLEDLTSIEFQVLCMIHYYWRIGETKEIENCISDICAINSVLKEDILGSLIYYGFLLKTVTGDYFLTPEVFKAK